MDSSDAAVFRPASVSSIRRTIVPPYRRANNQLKMKVRALPMCKKPVGEGAKRTRTIGSCQYNKPHDFPLAPRGSHISADTCNWFPHAPCNSCPNLRDFSVERHDDTARTSWQPACSMGRQLKWREPVARWQSI